MGLTDATRNTAAAGAVVLLAGVSVTLVVIRRWIVDTTNERRILAAAQRQAEGERSRYFAARAALENEQCRLNRDMNAERQAIAVRLKAERGALQSEFEKGRSALIAETIESTVLMLSSGKPAPGQKPGNLIPFPSQQQDPAPERERSREHNEVAP